MNRRVSAAARLRDAGALLLVVAGIALFAWGNARLRSMAAGRITTVPARTAVQQAERYEALARIGLGVALLGVGAGFWSYHRYARSRRSHHA